MTGKELVRRTQELFDAVVPVDPAPWEKYYADDCIFHDEKGRSLDKTKLIADIVPLPKGYSGTITVTKLQSVITSETAILSYDTNSVDQSKVAAIGFCFGGSAVQTLAYTGTPPAGVVCFHGGPAPAPASAKGKVKAKFLLLNGAIDKMVPPNERAELEKSLEAAGVDYQSIDYAGALHAFSNPDADRIAREKGMEGMIGYNEPAARRAWKQMQIFFAEIFAAR